jgi:glutamate transport system permease protein
MSSVLYDAPGPVTRRRERVGSVVAAAVILVALFFAMRYAAGRGVFQADHWDVLYDPPKNQTAADVWSSLVVRGLGATLRAAAVAAPLALALGFALALWRTARWPWLRLPAVAVIELFRGLPVLLMMLFGTLALDMDPFSGVVFGLVVYNMAIFAEILRAGLATLPKGQTEAAYAVGLTRWQAMWTVQLPQAVRIMLPSLVAQLVVLLKDSSLGFIVSYPELLKAIQNNGQYFGNRYFVALFVVGAGIYLAVNLTLSWFARWLSRRTAARTGRGVDPAAVVLSAARGGPAAGRGTP